MSSRVLSGEKARQAGPLHWRESYDRPAAPAGQASQEDPATSELRRQVERLAARAAELERMVEQARREGHREGEAVGFQRANAGLEPLFTRLARSIEELAGYRPRLRRDAELDLVKLGMAIARRILHRELSVDPQALLGLVKAALDRMDARELHRVRVHPQDAERLRSYLDGLGMPVQVEVQADGSLERGGVLLESSRGALDASIHTQLEEIERGFADLVERRR